MYAIVKLQRSILVMLSLLIAACLPQVSPAEYLATDVAQRRVAEAANPTATLPAPTATASQPTPTPVPQATEIPVGRSEWYFAEGFTADAVKLYLLSLVEQQVTVTYYFPDTGPESRQYDVPSLRPFEIDVTGELRPDVAVGMKVTAPQPLVAQRLVDTGIGLHTSLGSPEISPVWYFAEGFTQLGFNAVYTIVNPGTAPVSVDVTYFYVNGRQQQRRHVIEGQRRYTISAEDPAEAGPELKFGAIFRATDGQIGLERSMPFAEGVLNNVGVQEPQNQWFFAEGDPTKATFFTFLNPNSFPAEVTLKYFPEGATSPPDEKLTLPPFIPTTIEFKKDWEVGFSTEISSDEPILVERAIYFAGGGHSSEGASEPARSWIFPIGDTREVEGGLIQSWVLIHNPAQSVVVASFTYYLDTGEVVTVEHPLPPGRSSFAAALDIGAGHLYALRVSAAEPIVAEQAIYAPVGGAVSLGYPIP